MNHHPTNAKLLLTGASGFLGRAILRECESSAITVRCLTRSVQEEHGQGDFHQIDLVNQSLPANLFAGIDTVIHCAGLAHQFGKSSTNEAAFHAVNVNAVENTIRAAATHGVQRFVLISSSGVYGPGGDYQSEDAECNPVGPYATSKLNGEKIARKIASEKGIELVILRMTTLYGAGDRGNVNRLIEALDRTTFVSIGNGSNKKSLIHKSDAAQACLLAAQREVSTPISVYNVGVNPVSMKQVLSGICDGLNRSYPICFPASLITPVSGTISRLCFGQGPFARIHRTIRKWLANDSFNGEKFARDFSFVPKMDLPNGLSDQVAHYRSKSVPTIRGSVLKRAFDLALALLLLILFSLPMVIISVLIKLTSKGPVLFWSRRVGRGGKTFPMAKFRTMRTDTPEVATHLLLDAKSYITAVGRVLRKTSLDELPQLLNILVGHMSFVGPRPSLPSQSELNELRKILGVLQIQPGITGWAAVNGRDELLCVEKVEFDRQYLDRQSFLFDLKIIFMTALIVVKRDGVKQAGDSGQNPFVLIRKGQHPTVLATPDAITAATGAFRSQTNQIICLRTDSKIDLATIQSAVEEGSSVLFIRRKDDSSLNPHAVEVDLKDTYDLESIVLSKRSSGVEQQFETDVNSIFDHQSGRTPEIQDAAMTEQTGV